MSSRFRRIGPVVVAVLVVGGCVSSDDRGHMVAGAPNSGADESRSATLDTVVNSVPIAIVAPDPTAPPTTGKLLESEPVDPGDPTLSIVHNPPHIIPTTGDVIEMFAGCGCVDSAVAAVRWSEGSSEKIALDGEMGARFSAMLLPPVGATWAKYALTVTLKDGAVTNVPAEGEFRVVVMREKFAQLMIAAPEDRIQLTPEVLATAPIADAEYETYVADPSSTTLHVLVPRNGEGDPIKPEGFAITAKASWILNNADNNIIRIDDAGAITAIPIDPGVVDILGARALAVSDDETTMFVAFDNEIAAFRNGASKVVVLLWRRAAPLLKPYGFEIVNGALVGRLGSSNRTVLAAADGSAAAKADLGLDWLMDTRAGTAKVTILDGDEIVREFELTSPTARIWGGYAAVHNPQTSVTWVLVTELHDPPIVGIRQLVAARVDGTGRVTTYEFERPWILGEGFGWDIVRGDRVYFFSGGPGQGQVSIESTRFPSDKEA